MFDKLLSWLREKARLWFGEDTPISVSVSAPMESAITLWAQMYDTGGPWCHGGKDPLHSLGLPQSIAAELARLTTLEMECLVSGSARADSINELLKPFIADLRIPVEYGCALGRGAVPALSRPCWPHPNRCGAGGLFLSHSL